MRAEKRKIISLYKTDDNGRTLQTSDPRSARGILRTYTYFPVVSLSDTDNNRL